MSRHHKYSRMRSKASSECKTERVKDCRMKSIEEMKELARTKTEEALQLASKGHDLWMYQNEKEEAKRLQGCQETEEGNGLYFTKKIGRIGLTGMRRERWKKMSGGWSLQVKRKWRKSLSCRIRWKALSWIWMVKAAVSRKKQSSREEEERYSTRVRKLSHKRKMIRVESEEIQDYVREAKSTEYEEEEKRTFVPSAVSVPLKLLSRCDNQCSEKNPEHWAAGVGCAY